MIYGIFYGLAGMAWYKVCPHGHGMVYDMALLEWHGSWYGIWYSLIDMAWYMEMLGGHGIWYSLSGMAWYMVLLGMVYGMAWQAWHGIGNFMV